MNNKLKIVIISGVIYPQNSPRSFRATELAKGLAKMGHEVTLYAVLGKFDYSGFENEYGIKVKSLGVSYCGNSNSDGERLHLNPLNKILIKLLGNLIDFPRTEYSFQVNRALKAEADFDYLITIAHPYGIHWGAAYFKSKCNNHQKFKVWASDCGDPFMGDPDVKRIKLFLERIEKFWCRQTDYIVIPVVNGINGYYKEFHNKIRIIPQGIDFNSVKTLPYIQNKIPTFLYCGAIYPDMRDPSRMLDYLCMRTDIDFRFVVYSKHQIFDDYKKKLGDKLDIRPGIQRSELIKIQSTMDFLVNISNNSVVQTPSKLIDYSLAKRPIYTVSSSFTTEERNNLDAFLNGNYEGRTIVKNVEQYDSKNVCKSFIDLFYDKI